MTPTPCSLSSPLSAAAWAWLWRVDRAELARQLQAELEVRPSDPELATLHRLWLIEAGRLPHEAERLGRTAPLADQALQALVEARCAQMYDAPAAALRHAREALAQLEARDPQHPLCLHARFAFGFALLESGWPGLAMAEVQRLLRDAHRDALPLLQLDGLHLLARCADEAGEPALRATAQRHALALVAQHAEAAGLPAWDSLQRLAWRRALAAQDLPALTRWLQHPAADGLDLIWQAEPAQPLLQALLHQADTPPALLARLRTWIDRLLGPAPSAIAPPPAELTEREWQVLQGIGQQLSNVQVAHQLHLSLATVKTHINRLYSKLRLSSRTQAVQRARQLMATHPTAEFTDHSGAQAAQRGP